MARSFGLSTCILVTCCCLTLAAATSNTTAENSDSISWMVQSARGAAGLGMGVVAAGIVIILLLSAFGNVGVPKDGASYEGQRAAEVPVEVRTHKKQKGSSQFMSG